MTGLDCSNEDINKGDAHESQICLSPASMIRTCSFQELLWLRKGPSPTPL
jgi:hypothetical protein